MNNPAELNSVEIDSTIQLAKAFYEMGQLNSLKHYYERGKLSVSPKNPMQEEEFNSLAKVIEEMEMFESINGRGSCLQLEHQSVVNLSKRGLYPADVIQNAQNSSWQPINNQGCKYPGTSPASS